MRAGQREGLLGGPILTPAGRLGYLVKKGRWCWLRMLLVRGDSVLAMTSLNHEATSTSSVSKRLMKLCS